MKKLMVMLLSGLIAVSAMASSVEHFKKKDGQLGGIVGKNLIFIYNDNEASKITNKDKLKLMGIMTQKRICSDKQMSSVIEKAGINVIFVYPSKDNKEVTILTINSCEKGD